MPLTRLICPHCEQPVEFNVTSVTRSRECPLCGNTILLQLTGQQKSKRRKALLTPSVEAEGVPEPVAAAPGPASAAAADPTEPPPGLAVAPRPIQGDLRDRMLADPEVRQRVKVIKISAVILGVVLLVVVLGSVFHWWGALGDAASRMNQRRTSTDDSALATVPPVSPTQKPALREPSLDPLPEAPLTPAKVDPTPAPAAPTIPAPFKVDKPSTEPDAILTTVKTFLEAPNADQRLKYVLSQKLVEPKFREYYKHHSDGPIPYETVESLGAGSGVGNALEFAVVMPDGERRRLVVRQSVKQGYLVDWPSFVIYSEMEWTDFVRERPQKPVLFRIMAQLTDVYEGEFADPSKFVCLKIVNPQDMRMPPLYAYAWRNTSLGHSIEFVMGKAAGGAVPLMLKLKFPEGGGLPNQVLIDEFVGEGWVARIW